MTTIKLPQDSIKTLKKLMRQEGTTLTATIQKAVATESFIQDELNKGNNILVQKVDRTFVQVLFPKL